MYYIGVPYGVLLFNVTFWSAKYVTGVWVLGLGLGLGLNFNPTNACMHQPTIQADAGENGGSQRQHMMARCARN